MLVSSQTPEDYLLPWGLLAFDPSFSGLWPPRQLWQRPPQNGESFPSIRSSQTDSQLRMAPHQNVGFDLIVVALGKVWKTSWIISREWALMLSGYPLCKMPTTRTRIVALTMMKGFTILKGIPPGDMLTTDVSLLSIHVRRWKPNNTTN